MDLFVEVHGGLGLAYVAGIHRGEKLPPLSMMVGSAHLSQCAPQAMAPDVVS